MRYEVVRDFIVRIVEQNVHGNFDYTLNYSKVEEINAFRSPFHERNRRLELNDLRSKLSRLGAVRSNEFLLRFSVPPYELTVFPDGRAIIKGTRDAAVARSLYAKYLGG
jgi:hypothetical protein